MDMSIPHKLCPSCGNAATLDAALCVRCGHQYRTQLLANRTQFMNVGLVPIPAPYRAHRSRPVAAIWAFVFGGLGAHKFYLGEHGWGVAYLLLCWTFIPAIVSVIDAVVLLMMSDFTFDTLYNPEWVTWPY